MTTTAWDKTVDILIVGSGAGSVCAALVAKDHGLEALILEKQSAFGGTTAWSGGGVWIPNNHLMARSGEPDSIDAARQYLDHAVWHDGACCSAERREAFLQNGAKAIEYLESKGMRMQRAHFWPDYHSNLPGGCQTSRSLYARMFDVNELGEWKNRLSAPNIPPLRFHIEELHGLMVVKRSWKARWLGLKVVLRMLAAKLRGQDLRAAGQAWQGRLLQIALRERLPLWLDSPVRELITEDGRVVGVEAEHEGRTVRIRATRGVLLNAGGYARNNAFRERHGRQPVFPQTTNAGLGDTGEMIEAGMAIGAAADCLDESLWGFSSMGPGETFPEGATTADGTPTPFGHHFDISLPHSMIVDQDGRRFCDEATSYMEAVQCLYRRHAETGRGIPAWAIIESRHRDNYLWGFNFGKTPQSWIDSGYMVKADTVEELAAKCGIDAAGLRGTVDRFNGFARSGVDTDYGRGGKAFDNCHGDPTVKPNPNLGAIEKPPFYAVRIYPGDVSTWGGLVTDAHARVLREDGSVIEGLYATGTTTASPFGRTYPGAGASIGPALTFGYVAARHMAGA